MGPFSKRPKIEPVIIIEDIRLKLINGDEWQFNYSGTEFYHFDPEFIFPGKGGLDKILAEVNALKTELRERVVNGLKEWNPTATAESLEIAINLTDFSKNGYFLVSVSGNESWGDMGVDFEIKNGRIVEEYWGD